MTLDPKQLQALERAVEQALQSGDESGLRVLGYGEISAVLAVDTPEGRFAAKRLPPFSGASVLVSYRNTLESYIAALETAGVRVVPTDLCSVTRPDGSLTAYAVQPILDPATLGPVMLAKADDSEAERLLADIVTQVLAAVTPVLGLDGQLSNWAWNDDAWSYLDVTTPLMRDARGRELLDVELFLCSLPWALRPVVRRFMLRGILDKYYEPRGVLLDLAGNLHKEGLGHAIPALLGQANRHVSPDITSSEVKDYYASDARTWALLQQLRRADRVWQRRVRRRSYGFLLPGAIERRV